MVFFLKELKLLFFLGMSLTWGGLLLLGCQKKTNESLPIPFPSIKVDSTTSRVSLGTSHIIQGRRVDPNTVPSPESIQSTVSG